MSEKTQDFAGLLREWQRMYNAMDSKHEDKHPTADSFSSLRERTHAALSRLSDAQKKEGEAFEPGTDRTAMLIEEAGGLQVAANVFQGTREDFERFAALYTTPPAAAEAPAVPQWIEDPHDIEQGWMLNPEWLKLRGMTAAQFYLATPTDSAANAGAVRPTDDELWDKTLKERDDYHDAADSLAWRIAAITGVDIGEHSSANNPWQNAMDAADEWFRTDPDAAPKADSSEPRAHDWIHHRTYFECRNCGLESQSGMEFGACIDQSPEVEAIAAAMPEPTAWLTTDDDGSPDMVFLDKQEAASYCDGEEPVSLFTADQLRAAQPQADAGVSAADRVRALMRDRSKRVYIAGPMTGLPEYNFPAFNAKAAELRAEGWHVENPAEHGHVEGAVWADYLRYDLSRIATCGAIYLLPGWEKSKGACLEVQVAEALGMAFHGISPAPKEGEL